jgi:hypothetical protein
VTKSPVKLSDLFRYYKQLPHQMAAIVELEAALLKVAPDAFNKDQPWFKTWSQAGKQPNQPAWFDPARKIVAELKFALMKNAGDSPTKRNVTSAWNCASLSRKPALSSVTSQSSLPAGIGQKM